jgi:DNA helicase-2/ATP-dependent DNA helicase PcrA
MKNWSKYQEAIFEFVENGEGNAVIEAVAGSGKSTTIVEAMNRIPQGASSIFLAFNKAIADELKSRGVNARTFHSLTYSPVTRFKNTRQVDSDKTKRLCVANLKGNDAFLYGAFIQRLVGLAKQSGIGCLTPDAEWVWNAIVEHHDLDLDNESCDMTRAIELSREVFALSNASNMVDFDDMLYVPVKEGLSLPKFDFVFVDEAQDTNGIQRALLRKLLKPHTRIIAVGDPAQAIYGFRGADSNSLNLIAEEFNCTKLPLTVSYRCAQDIVTYAKQWVDHIEAREGAPLGSVSDLGFTWTEQVFQANDLVVCRTTQPLVSLGYRLMKKHIPVHIMGREIGAGLKSLINKLNAKGIDALITKLGAWRERECEKAIGAGNEAKVQRIEDKADAILCLIDGLQETSRTIPELIRVIDTLFTESPNAVVLATIHKSKGLEADRVFWLNRSQCPSKWARQPWQKQQESNLCYVAATRAKTSLTIIEEKK